MFACVLVDMCMRVGMNVSARACVCMCVCELADVCRARTRPLCACMHLCVGTRMHRNCLACTQMRGDLPTCE